MPVQPLVDQVGIVLLGSHGRDPLVETGNPVQLELFELGRPEQALGQDKVILVVIDQQNSDLPSGHALDYGGISLEAPAQTEKGLSAKD
jgi:hypothetical protein